MNTTSNTTKLCPCCKEEKSNVIQRGPQTAYYWDGKGQDPNDPGEMCDECNAGYVEHWTEMWREYWYSQGR
jgi:hypothetical protein